MNKKKIFTALLLGSLIVGGSVGVAFGGASMGLLATDNPDYTATLSAEGAKTNLGNDLEVVTDGFEAGTDTYGTLAAGGYVEVEVNGAKSIVVNADTHANLTLVMVMKKAN